MRIVKILVLLMVAAVGISFAWLNAEPVSFHYYLGTGEVRLAWLLVLFLVAGWLAGVITLARVLISLRTRLALTRRKLEAARRALAARGVAVDETDTP